MRLPFERIWFDRPGVRWGRVVVVVLLGALGALAWLAQQRELWLGLPGGVVLAPGAVPPAPPLRPAPAVATAVDEAPPDLAAAPGPDVDSGTDEAAVDCDAADAAVRAAPDPRWLALMRGSGDERVRAAGWLIGLSLAEPGAAAPAWRDQLATLAAGSRDPAVIAFALQACRGAASAMCQVVTPEAWARFEPENALPWLALADAAAGDPSAVTEALQRAAQAQRLDDHGAALHALALGAQPAGASELDRARMGGAIDALLAGWPAPEVANRHCHAVALRDAARRPVCETLAGLFVERARTLAELRQGRALAIALGWDAERVAALREEIDALATLSRELREPQAADRCAVPAGLDRFRAEVGRVGELAALRQARPAAPR